MNRLATRLTLAMLAVAVVSLLVFTSAQTVAAVRAFQSLPDTVREQVTRRPFLAPPQRDPRFERGRDDGRFPPPSPADPAASDVGGRVPLLTFYEDFQRFQRRATLGAVAVAAALCVLLAVLLARGIARPIERVSRAAGRVAEGDLAARAPLGGAFEPFETAALARDFNRMAGALEAGEVERRAMVAAIAHELRTPLTGMQARLEALLDGLVPFDAGEAERLHRQSEVLARLIEDLRTASLADAGRLELRPRPTDLAALARDAAESARSAAGRSGVRLELDTPDTLPASVDPDRVRQILANLLDNAVRAAPEESAVELTLRNDGGRATLAVADRGPGIAEGELDAVFERFRQGADTRGRSGLGLSVVRALAELHGGSARAERRAGGGTRMVVELPLEPPPDED